MAAELFEQEAQGATAQEAFDNARDTAGYSHGHSGYSGTIVEKETFEEIEVPEGKDPEAYVQELIEAEDSRIDDKWGPAGCVRLREGEYLFFGYASN